MTVYAIGDIHGHLDKLRVVHTFIEADRAAHGVAETRIIHLGDFVDRGPDVAGVLDYLLARRDSGAPDILLKGNHDRMMAWWLEAEPRDDPILRSDLTWLSHPLGGRESLASYGVDVSDYRWPDEIHAQARDRVPEAHRALLAGLSLMHREEGLVFCHAGVRPGIPLDAQVEDDLVWIRGGFLDSHADHGALVVHGHSVVDDIELWPNRLAIDTGAGYGDPLSAVALDQGAVWHITASGRVPIAERAGWPVPRDR